LLAEIPAHAQEKEKPAAEVEGQYATVNGLKCITNCTAQASLCWSCTGRLGAPAPILILAKNRQLIAVELQGHGHTADIDRPLSIEQMADDVAALLKHLKIDQADVFGYSMGGNVALALAIRAPDRVGRVAINGSHFGPMEEAYEPETFQQFKNLPADFAPLPLKGPYDKVAPDPKHWRVLVGKVKKMGLEWNGFTREQLKSIKALF
jgi:pimeloyl-ACP methyl ester carboxylesterase